MKKTMKKIFAIMVAVLLTTIIFLPQQAIAQAPQKMSYQAVIRDNLGILITEQEIGMQVTILQGTIDGTTVYQETHSPTSNINGLITIEIGDGTTGDDFSAIDWSNGLYFIKTEIDPTSLGGTTYTITGVSQLLGVPYAYYATTAGNVFSGDYNDLSNQPNFTNWDTDVTDDFDGDYTNLSNQPNFTGWDMNVADDFTGSYNDLTDVPVNIDIDATDDFSGDYNDLTNQPNFTDWDTDVTDDFDGDYTNLTNQPDFTGWDINDADDFSGSYNDLSDLPANLDIDATDDFNGDYTNLSNQPNFTGWDMNVADDFTGSYNDLTDVPVNIDTDATDDFSGDYNDLTNQPNFTNWDTDVTDDFDGDYNSLSNAPTNVSTFTNDSGYLTAENDGDITNEIQDITLAGTDITISSGSTIDLSVIDTDTQLDSTDIANMGYVADTDSFYLGQDTLGGIVYYIYKDASGTQHGLIVNKNETHAVWQETITITNSDRPEDGAYNTTLITNSAAATYATGFGAGWYLPSPNELMLLKHSSFSTNKVLRTDGFPLLDCMGSYWSSMEKDLDQAYCYYFAGGGVLITFKDDSRRVRAVRSF